MLDHYSLLPYHYATPKVGHLPPGRNQGGKWLGGAFGWEHVMGTLDWGKWPTFGVMVGHQTIAIEQLTSTDFSTDVSFNCC